MTKKLSEDILREREFFSLKNEATYQKGKSQALKSEVDQHNRFLYDACGALQKQVDVMTSASLTCGVNLLKIKLLRLWRVRLTPYHNRLTSYTSVSACLTSGENLPKMILLTLCRIRLTPCQSVSLI